MKIAQTLIVLSVMLGSFAAQAAEPRLITVYGHRAICQTKFDVWNNRFGAYSLNHPNVVIHSAESVDISINVDFFKCVKNDNDTASFVRISPFSALNYQVLKRDGSLITVDVERKHAKIVATGVDRNADILGAAPIWGVSELYGATVNISVIKAMTDAQRDRLHSGETVRVRVNLAESASLTLRGSDGTVQPTQTYVGGEFYLYFDATMNGDDVTVTYAGTHAE